MTQQANIRIVRGDATVIFTDSDSLDLTNYQQFHEQLRLASFTDSVVEVDLTEVQFIDTAVVLCVTKAATTMLKRSNRLRVLVSESAYPRRVLKMSGFDEIMDIVEVPAR